MNSRRPNPRKNWRWINTRSAQALNIIRRKRALRKSLGIASQRPFLAGLRHARWAKSKNGADGCAMPWEESALTNFPEFRSNREAIWKHKNRKQLRKPSQSKRASRRFV